jgi:ABC-type transporter Mla subunit MlaD
MAIPLPRPTAVVGLTRSALDQAFGSAVSFAAVPARAMAVLDGVEALLTRINGVVDRIETTLDRTDGVLTDAESAVREVAVISAAATTAIDSATEVAAAAAVVVGEAEQVSAAAAVVVREADKVARTAGTVVTEVDAVAARAAGTVRTAAEAAATAAELLAAYEPSLRRAAPMAGRFIEQLSHEEVTAAIRLVDELPKLKQHLTADILPILATLDRVGPDLHDLLDVTRDLKLAVAGIPGLGMLRRRGEKLTDDTAG